MSLTYRGHKSPKWVLSRLTNHFLSSLALQVGGGGGGGLVAASTLLVEPRWKHPGRFSMPTGGYQLMAPFTLSVGDSLCVFSRKREKGFFLCFSFFMCLQGILS